MLRQNDWALMREWATSHPDLEQLADLERPGALTAALNWYRANMHPRPSSRRAAAAAGAGRHARHLEHRRRLPAGGPDVRVRAHIAGSGATSASRAPATGCCSSSPSASTRCCLTSWSEDRGRTQGGVRRARTVPRRADRRRRRRVRRLRHAHARAGARGGQARRAGLQGRHRAPARRPDARGQGPLRHRGRAHDLRLADLRRPRPEGRRRGGPAGQGRGRDRRRQDAHARVRLGHHLDQPALPAVPQPVGPGARPGRVERRLRRSRWPPAPRRSRSAPTPAARSASRPRSAASPA